VAKKTKAEKAAEAAVGAAADAAKDALALSRTLPKKDAKKLRALADDAADAAEVSKKRLARKPRKVEKDASAAVAALGKATGKIEARRADRAAEKDAAERLVEKARRRATSIPAEEAPREGAPVGSAPADVEEGEIQRPAPAVAGEPEPGRRTPRAAVAPFDASSLESLSVTELRARARSEQRTGYSRLTKAQLIELLS
jgi:hypothetical protein